jgi:hypothetical protein
MMISLKSLYVTVMIRLGKLIAFGFNIGDICRGGSRDSFDGEGGLSYGAIFSIIDGSNCSPKEVLACRSVNLVFISFSV